MADELADNTSDLGPEAPVEAGERFALLLVAAIGLIGGVILIYAGGLLTIVGALLCVMGAIVLRQGLQDAGTSSSARSAVELGALHPSERLFVGIIGLFTVTAGFVLFDQAGIWAKVLGSLLIFLGAGVVYLAARYEARADDVRRLYVPSTPGEQVELRQALMDGQPSGTLHFGERVMLGLVGGPTLIGGLVLLQAKTANTYLFVFALIVALLGLGMLALAFGVLHPPNPNDSVKVWRQRQWLDALERPPKRALRRQRDTRNK